MPEEFVNAEEVKVKETTESELTSQQKIDLVANRLAGKPADTEKTFDKENGTLFNK